MRFSCMGEILSRWGKCRICTAHYFSRIDPNPKSKTATRSSTFRMTFHLTTTARESIIRHAFLVYGSDFIEFGTVSHLHRTLRLAHRSKSKIQNRYSIEYIQNDVSSHNNGS